MIVCAKESFTTLPQLVLFRKRGRLSRDAFKQNRQKARQKEAAAAEENLRRRVACGHAEIAIAQIDKRNRAAPEQAAQAASSITTSGFESVCLFCMIVLLL